jgi:hypothetical protein
MNSLEHIIAALLIGAWSMEVPPDGIVEAIKPTVDDWGWREKMRFTEWLGKIAERVNEDA